MVKIVLTLCALSFCLFAKAQYNRDLILETILKTDTTTIGQKIVYPSFPDAQISILKITIPPGKSTGWHKHEFPVFAYVVQGVLSIEIDSGKTIQFMENTSFSEVINTYHNGKNDGKDELVLLAFFMGEKNKPLSVHKANDSGEKKE